MALHDREIIDLASVKDPKPEGEIILLIPVEDIDTSDRLRPVDSVAVEAIAASMDRDGLINPIDVCRLINQTTKVPFRLVCGAHRLAAAKHLGWTHINAIVRSASALERRSREIAENFFKASLSPIDEARFVAELIDNEKARLGIEPDKDGRALNADFRSEKAKKEEMDNDLRKMRKSLGLQDAVAERIGLSQQEVSRKLALMKLAPAITERVRKLDINGNASALRKLAGLSPAEQEKTVALIESGKAKGVSDAQAIIVNAPIRTREDKLFSTFIDTFGRMSPREQKAALTELKNHLPKGVQIVFDADKKPREKLPTNAEIRALSFDILAPAGTPPEAELAPEDQTVDIEEMIAGGGKANA